MVWITLISDHLLKAKGSLNGNGEEIQVWKSWCEVIVKFGCLLVLFYCN